MARPRTFDEDHMLEAISQQFRESGYAATSVDDLMERTGLGKGSLYGAFGSKHEMFVRCVRAYADEAAAAFETSLDGDDAGAFRRLRGFARESALNFAEDRFGCMLARATSERAACDDDVDAIAAQAFQRMEGALRRCIRAAQRAGDIDAGRDPKKLAMAVFAVLRGMDALGKSGIARDAIIAAADGMVGLLER